MLITTKNISSGCHMCSVSRLAGFRKEDGKKGGRREERTGEGKKQIGCLVICEFQLSKDSFYFNIWYILILKTYSVKFFKNWSVVALQYCGSICCTMK